MHDRRGWRTLVAAAVAVVVLAPVVGFAFPQSTETLGELPMDLNGVWFVVHHLEFPRPSPQATPAASPGHAAAKPAAAPKKSPPVRVVNTLNIYRIQHLKKADAQKVREAEAKMQQASVDKANAIVEEERKKNPPQQTEGGEVSGPRVIVPSIPRFPDDPTDQYDESAITLLDVTLPPGIEASLQKANKDEVAWEPTERDLALLKSSWSTLPASTRDEYSRLEWKVYAPKFYERASLQQDEKVRGSKFAITSSWAMIPKPGQAEKTIVVYGVRELSSTKLAGDHVRAIVAGGMFSVPIEMKGHFKMFKLAALPKDTDEAAAAATPDAKPTATRKENK